MRLVAARGASNPTDNVDPLSVHVFSRLGYPIRVSHAVFCAVAALSGCSRVQPAQKTAWETRMASWGTLDVKSHALTTVGGTADGSRQSTGDTVNMGESAGTGVW